MPGAAQTAQWYVTKSDGQEAGPFTNQQMKALVAQAKIGPATLVRRDGMLKAIPAANVQGLLSANSTVAVSRAAPPPVPPEVDGLDADQDDYEQEEEGEEESEEALRAPIGMRVVSSLIDSTAYGLVVIVSIIVFLALAFSPIEKEGSRIEARWQQEVDRLVSSSNIEHHKRILGIERLPRPAESYDDVFSQIAEYKRMFENVAQEPDPGELRDLIVLEWRQRREGDSPDGPVTEAEREAVVNWSQYEEFEPFVRRRELSFRREVRGNVDRLQSLQGIFRQDMDRAARSSGLRALIMGLVLFPLLALFMPLCEYFLGATPGKLLLGYRVATLHRYPVGLGKAILRMLLRMIPFYFVTAFTVSRQGLHDSLTGTQVIPKESVLQRTKERKVRGARKGGGRRRRR